MICCVCNQGFQYRHGEVPRLDLTLPTFDGHGLVDITGACDVSLGALCSRCRREIEERATDVLAAIRLVVES